MTPTVSIITITYNAGQFVDETIRSVLAQSSTDYEYVFIDGASSDDTLQRVEAYREQFESKGIVYRVYSEPDKGIYDAMNKGVQRAEGTWVQMLNAGDQLAGPEVLAAVFGNEHSDADVLYGDCVLHDEGYYKISRAQALDTITQGMPFCHQCLFVRRSVLAQYGFDLKYRLAADYDQLLRCYRDQKVFRYVPALVAVYDVSGVSERNFRASLEEQRTAGNRLGYPTQRNIERTLLVRKVLRLLRRLLPRWMRSKQRGWYPSLEQAIEQY